MKVGVLGPGRIASTMAGTIMQMTTAENYAVASRDIEKAKAFAEKFGFRKVYGSYEEMLSDPECAEMPHSESIRMLEWMDALRGQMGIKYPQEM